MDFYVTLSSGPTKNEPHNESWWCEYKPEIPIKLDGDYEVALVQSVFENVFSGPLATINIFPSFSNMEMYTFYLLANDGDDIERIIQKLNNQIQQVFGSAVNSPKAILNSGTREFYIVLPDGWQIFITDVDLNHLDTTNKTLHYKFKSHKFFYPRHFNVCTNLVEGQLSVDNLLTNICLEDFKSNVVLYESKSPRYVKVKDNNLTKIDLDYIADINLNQIFGKITSTLHFKKINGF